MAGHVRVVKVEVTGDVEKFWRRVYIPTNVLDYGRFKIAELLEVLTTYLLIFLLIVEIFSSDHFELDASTFEKFGSHTVHDHHNFQEVFKVENVLVDISG